MLANNLSCYHRNYFVKATEINEIHATKASPESTLVLVVDSKRFSPYVSIPPMPLAVSLISEERKEHVHLSVIIVFCSCIGATLYHCSLT